MTMGHDNFWVTSSQELQTYPSANYDIPVHGGAAPVISWFIDLINYRYNIYILYIYILYIYYIYIIYCIYIIYIIYIIYYIYIIYIYYILYIIYIIYIYYHLYIYHES